MIGDRNATAAWETGLRDAFLASLTPMVRGRSVTLVSEPPAVASFASCRAADCIGAAVANAHGIGALIVRLRMRDPRTLDMQLELVDPVSGAPRHEAMRGLIPMTARSAPSSVLVPLLEQLGSSMPTPPPAPATLLITVTADDANVVIDGHDVGRSPIAPISMPAGRYTVVVTRAGYESLTRLVQVGDTGPTRADFDLVPSEETAAAIESSATGTLAPALVSEHGSANARDGAGATEEETPIYLRWYAIAGAAAVVVAAVVIIAVASGGGETLPPNGIPVPPIVR
jgi:hypothetical protein